MQREVSCENVDIFEDPASVLAKTSEMASNPSLRQGRPR